MGKKKEEKNTEAQETKVQTETEANQEPVEETQDKNAEELKKAQDALAAQKDSYLRLAAEYDNYRKRTQAEKLSIYDDATAKAVEKLLPVADSLDMALMNMGDAPDEFKNLHRIYLSNLPVNGKISFTTLLNNPNLEDVIMNRGNERLNAKEVLLEFRSKVSDIMSDFYDFDRNKMIKKKSVTPGYEEELYKYIKKLTKQQKRSFIKRISLKSTGIVIFSMFLFNKFKYLTNKYTKYRENTKQSNIKPEKSKV